MQPIIRRTITITITETWTITWADGSETMWHTTREAAWPTDLEPEGPLPPLMDDAESAGDAPIPDAADPPVAANDSLG